MQDSKIIPVFIDKTIEDLAEKVEVRRKTFSVNDLKEVIKMIDINDGELLARAVRNKNHDLFTGAFEVLIYQYIQGEIK